MKNKFLPQLLIALTTATIPFFAQATAIVAMHCTYVDKNYAVLRIENETIGFANRKNNFLEEVDKLDKNYGGSQAGVARAQFGPYSVTVTTKAQEYAEPMEIEFRVALQTGLHKIIPAVLNDYQTRVTVLNEDRREISCSPYALLGADRDQIKSWKK